MCSVLRYVKYIIKAVLTLHVLAENPRHAELERKVGARALKATGDVSLLVSYSNSQKVLIRIPFTVKHITKCLCFVLKKKYKFSMVTIIYLE